MRTFALAVLLGAALLCTNAFASIQISIDNPVNGYNIRSSYWTSNAFVRATISSSYELVSVVAEMDASVASLAYTGQHNTFSGYIAIPSAIWGTHQLSVTAADVFGNTSTSSIEVILDAPPVVIVHSPADRTVARPTVRITADCLDDGPGCQAIWAEAGGTSLATGTTSLDAVVDLAGLGPSSRQTDFWAYDGRQMGYGSDPRIVVYVETSDKLSEYVSAPAGNIQDFNELYSVYGIPVRTNGGTVVQQSAKGLLRHSDRATVILSEYYTDNARDRVNWATVTGYGAIYGVLGGYLRERRESTDSQLGSIHTSMEKAGNLLIRGDWKSKFVVNNSEDQSSQEFSSSPIASNDLSPQMHLLENGSFAFITGPTPTSIWLYNAPTFQQIATSNGSGTPSGPVTDGTNVVYRRCQGTAESPYAPCEIVLYTPESAETVVSSTSGAVPARHTDYQIRDGWVAYTAVSEVGIKQVWIRSPTGSTQKLSVFGSDTVLERDTLHAGEVMMLTREERWLGQADVLPVLISTSSGISKKVNGYWFVAIGRTLFAVDLGSLPPPPPPPPPPGDAGPADAGPNVDAAPADASIADGSTSVDASNPVADGGPVTDGSPPSDAAQSDSSVPDASGSADGAPCGYTISCPAPDATSPPPDRTILVRTIPEPPGTNCTDGGTVVLIGIDHNENGTLDYSEVQQLTYVCYTSDSDSRVPVLSGIRDEPPGVNCPSGGHVIQAGVDLDTDGALAPHEVRSTTYICQSKPTSTGCAIWSTAAPRSLWPLWLTVFFMVLRSARVPEQRRRE
jgi:hypothetical protein